MIVNFNQFMTLNEGGLAIKTSRRIRQDEADETLAHIESTLFPLLGGGNFDGDFLLIGSLGKKKNPSDDSGDIDLGISEDFLIQQLGSTPETMLSDLEEFLSTNLPEFLGFEPEMKLMKGLRVLSIGWPINGDPNQGIVQLDLIPISDMDWARFIYYSPDYRVDESVYKSAHRNWLFQAILSSLKTVESRDDEGNIMDYEGYVLRLSEGIFKSKKSYRGIKKNRLSRPQTIEGTVQFVTNDPHESVKLMFGPGLRPENVKTFEDAWNLVTSPNFVHQDKLPEITEDLVRYLEKAKLPIPVEVQKEQNLLSDDF
jgi:hypothetical protein